MNGVPQFVYSIQSALCRFPANFADMNLENVSLESQCFLRDRDDVIALTHNVNKNLLYFVENTTKTISRVQLDDGQSPSVIVGGTGRVEGLNLHWLLCYCTSVFLIKVLTPIPK